MEQRQSPPEAGAGFSDGRPVDPAGSPGPIASSSETLTSATGSQSVPPERSGNADLASGRGRRTVRRRRQWSEGALLHAAQTRLAGFLSGLLHPGLRTTIEYAFLFYALLLLALLTLMHLSFVDQPACAAEFSNALGKDSQMILIRVTDTGARFWDGEALNEEPIIDRRTEERDGLGRLAVEPGGLDTLPEGGRAQAKEGSEECDAGNRREEGWDGRGLRLPQPRPHAWDLPGPAASSQRAGQGPPESHPGGPGGSTAAGLNSPSACPLSSSQRADAQEAACGPAGSGSAKAQSTCTPSPSGRQGSTSHVDSALSCVHTVSRGKAQEGVSQVQGSRTAGWQGAGIGSLGGAKGAGRDAASGDAPEGELSCGSTNGRGDPLGCPTWSQEGAQGLARPEGDLGQLAPPLRREWALTRLTAASGHAAAEWLAKEWVRRLNTDLMLLWRLLKSFSHASRGIMWLLLSALGDQDKYADSVLQKMAWHKSPDPLFLYSQEKAFLWMSEKARVELGVKTANMSLSANNPCFGPKWQALLIDLLVGYDTILMNSLIAARGQGYLYNVQAKELYSLNYFQVPELLPAASPLAGTAGMLRQGIEEILVFKIGVMITSLFVFFMTTMAVSFTLRETQARMFKFTMALQHYARHRLPTFRLICVHVMESLVFVPIMIGILFFLFEFYEDQLLAFMVLTLVWLCEIFTLMSIRSPSSLRFFPKFFFLYFLLFHIYFFSFSYGELMLHFFSFSYGFSYLAFETMSFFVQHAIMFFWNHCEMLAAQQDHVRLSHHQQQQQLRVSYQHQHQHHQQQPQQAQARPHQDGRLVSGSGVLWELRVAPVSNLGPSVEVEDTAAPLLRRQLVHSGEHEPVAGDHSGTGQPLSGSSEVPTAASEPFRGSTASTQSGGGSVGGVESTMVLQHSHSREGGSPLYWGVHEGPG